PQLMLLLSLSVSPEVTAKFIDAVVIAPPDCVKVLFAPEKLMVRSARVDVWVNVPPVWLYAPSRLSVNGPAPEPLAGLKLKLPPWMLKSPLTVNARLSELVTPLIDPVPVLTTVKSPLMVCVTLPDSIVMAPDWLGQF